MSAIFNRAEWEKMMDRTLKISSVWNCVLGASVLQRKLRLTDGCRSLGQ